MACKRFKRVGHHGRESGCVGCDESETVVLQRSTLSFRGIQIKGEEAFHRFAAAVATIEEVTGIHCVNVQMEDVFVCPDIDMDRCCETPMERLLVRLIGLMHGRL